MAIVRSGFAQDQPHDLVRILELARGRYTCTALGADRQLEQLTVLTVKGSPPPAELRRGSATQDDLKRVQALLEQPEIRSSASQPVRVPQVMIEPDGGYIAVLARVDDKPKLIQFTDVKGQKTMPQFLKGFHSFAEDIRRRKLPKTGGKVTPSCELSMR